MAGSCLRLPCRGVVRAIPMALRRRHSVPVFPALRAGIVECFPESATAECSVVLPGGASSKRQEFFRVARTRLALRVLTRFASDCSIQLQETLLVGPSGIV